MTNLCRILRENWLENIYPLKSLHIMSLPKILNAKNWIKFDRGNVEPLSKPMLCHWLEGHRLEGSRTYWDLCKRQTVWWQKWTRFKIFDNDCMKNYNKCAFGVFLTNLDTMKFKPFSDSLSLDSFNEIFLRGVRENVCQKKIASPTCNWR